MSKSKNAKPDIIIKKYANRRLYDTSTSQYVTLDHLRELVKQDLHFQVIDAKSGEDLTHGVLAQIIFEEESRGANLLPVDFLRQLIGFYGDSLQSVVPGYLQMSMNNFTQQQEEYRTKVGEAMMSPQATMALIEEQTRRNMEAFGKTMRMFTPFVAGAEAHEAAAPAAPKDGEDDLTKMRAELDEMRNKLDQVLKAQK
ncbi:polyhydroxyalkanoate synthesis repressor PhaR [uncultured Maricaulis sp.]|uniref:polyhydroxyalkanoate synthesis repressor PhaR n=1 Tax=uncultured Maricaulis sp. TaxID=174710 RepID=UPI0030DAA709